MELLFPMSFTNKMPREEGIDQSLKLLREGYLYVSNRCQSFHSNIFETRLLGKKTICMRGKEAAELFYDTEKFKRTLATPNRTIQTLTGKHGVQSLDGEEHKHRKELIMSIMTPDLIAKLIDITRNEWELSINEWSQKKKIGLYQETKVLLCKSAFKWVGIPLLEHEVKMLTKDLGRMFESAAAFGPKNWHGRNSRNTVEKWIGKFIEGVRDGTIKPPDDSILHKFTWHRDLSGNLLNTRIVAVEIINILRPIVAISIYICFTAISLHHYPEEKEKLKGNDEKYAEMFIQEVRRFYPFFPYIMAIVKKDFLWKGYQIDKETPAILDLYGTNHDPTYWENPELFLPNRFVDWKSSPFGFIPQGGGDHFLGHRCAGEWATIEMMKISLDFLVNRIEYDVPHQDLSYSMVKIPSIPHSKFIIENIQIK